MVGVLPAFVAALGFAAFQTVNRRALSGVDVYRGTASVLVVGTAVLGGLSLVLYGPSAFVGAPTAAYGYFAAAGLVHFLFGWTLLGVSQLRLGAARAGIVVGTLPLFGALVAAVALDEPLTLIDLAGLALVVGGVVLVVPGRRGPERRDRRAEPSGAALGVAAGLATAALWAVSPVLIRGGLQHVVAPIVGATMGLAAAAVVYALLIAVGAVRPTGGVRRPPITSATRLLLVAAGAAVAVGISMQWTAYGLAPIAVVLSVLQLTPPLVVLLAVLLAREPLGDRAWMVWLGSVVTLAGALVLILW